jgi:hypothetical protein
MNMDANKIAAVWEKYMKDLSTAERTIPENNALPQFKQKLLVFRGAIPVINEL